MVPASHPKQPAKHSAFSLRLSIDEQAVPVPFAFTEPKQHEACAVPKQTLTIDDAPIHIRTRCWRVPQSDVISGGLAPVVIAHLFCYTSRTYIHAKEGICTR